LLYVTQTQTEGFTGPSKHCAFGGCYGKQQIHD